ncbi:class I histocompatibility antigen, F10 alpha chain-like [Hypanus sabinus]|uniref:class I histocompatibility antigen, F10 alpha chain-like n=1 Tax=Hypanus sabinus TaxID=79690 RepID=UPI0028C430D2|nr:class I histocompatibility antigen, F10 alpha chain-like [Hypanus sabinus]
MLLILCALCLSIRSVCPETHTLQYFYTSMTGDEDFPEFVHVGLLDDVQITYFDNRVMKDISRQTWMNGELDDDYWKKETQRLINRHKLSMANLQIAIQRTNRNMTELNYLQYTSSCQLIDNHTVSGVRQFAFNGQDLISFDLEHATWVTTSPIAISTRDKWNSDNSNNLYKKHYTEQICVKWLKKYLEYGAQTLSRKAVPDVKVYSKMTPDGESLFLHCLATGFYPQAITVTWLRDGQPLPPLKNSGILPNHDNTYQIKVSLLLEPGERRQHVCRVQHSSQPEGVDFTWEPGSGVSTLLIVLILLPIVITALGAGIWLIYNRRSCRGSKGSISKSDSGSEQSAQMMPRQEGNCSSENGKMLV